ADRGKQATDRGTAAAGSAARGPAIPRVSGEPRRRRGVGPPEIEDAAQAPRSEPVPRRGAVGVLPMRYRIGRRERRGTALVYLPLLLFALLALASLVIDLGWARAAQRQMQTAVDAAALEGLRGQNADANALAAWTFDDDFDPSADARSFGAG